MAENLVQKQYFLFDNLFIYLNVKYRRGGGNSATLKLGELQKYMGKALLSKVTFFSACITRRII